MEPTIGTLTDEQKDLLAQAAEWRLLGLLFECPNEGWRRMVAAMAREVKNVRLQGAARDALTQASEAMYHSLFGPGGPVAPREVSYRATIQLGYLLSELSAYYDTFDYHPETNEAPDHISVEIGFVAYLKLKEAYALSCGDPERAAVAAESCRQFTAEHLAATASPLALALKAIDPHYLTAAGLVLEERVGSPQGGQGPATTAVNDDDDDNDVILNCAW
jgi:nitrate reductase assembly molybdenum cofactor insertion protein NarJ